MGKNLTADNHTNHTQISDMGLGHADVPAKRPLSNCLIILCILAYLSWLLLIPRDAAKHLLAAMAWISVAFAGFRLAACIAVKPEDYGLADISPDLPKYTVLVPLFHEVQMVEQLMAGIREAALSCR